MIEIKNLTKVFKEKKKIKCVALNNISFTLPDKGMVFITGKSGSGKSTLLNMIARFDDVTNGEIIIDGNNITKLKIKELNKYHGTYLGFVFQDYHLIEELTVYQNIALSLDIIGKNDNGIISETLKQVGLEGYENRYPNELSGGERQRVAIARTIVKNPNIILGDEPTGNLDNVTTPQVLNILKEISKTRLVVIVSHNMIEADVYADRIIELSDGIIIKDIVRNKKYQNDFSIEDDILYLPHHDNLTKENIDYLLQNKEKINKIIQRDDGFKKAKSLNSKNKAFEFEDGKMSKKNIFKLFKLFFKRRIKNKIITVIMATMIISVFYVLQSFVNFNENEAIASTILDQKEEALIVHDARDIYETALNYSTISYDKIEKFENNYNGMVYKLYNSSIPIVTAKLPGETLLTPDILTKNFYITETYGTLVCEKQFLEKLFGKIKVLAGNINEPSYGTIITDYVADSLIYYYPDKYQTYEDLLGEYTYGKKVRCYIQAVIDTNYKTKYKSIIDIYNDYNKLGVNYSLKDNLANCKEYPDFIECVTKYIGISFSINPNYFEDLTTWDKINSYYIGNFYLSTENMNPIYLKDFFHVYKNIIETVNLNDNEIIMGYDDYNKIFSTEYTEKNFKTFTPHEVTLTKYLNSNTVEVFYTKTLTIKALSEDNRIYTNDNTYIELMKIDHMIYRLYFSDIYQTEKILNVLDEVDYSLFNNDTKGIYYVNRAIQVFRTLVLTLEFLVLLICLIYLISFGNKNIKKSYYEIGVLKTLGGKNKDIGIIFMLETLVVGIFIISFSVLGMRIATLAANKILLDSFSSVFSIQFFKINIISMYPNLITIDLIIVLLITLIASLIPLLTLRKFKYIDILKAKE